MCPMPNKTKASTRATGSARKPRKKGNTHPFRMGMKEFYPAPDVDPYAPEKKTKKARVSAADKDKPAPRVRRKSRQALSKKSEDTRDERKDAQLSRSHLTRRHAHDGARQRRHHGAQERK